MHSQGLIQRDRRKVEESRLDDYRRAILFVKIATREFHPTYSANFSFNNDPLIECASYLTGKNRFDYSPP
jgi:hypothetical protein